MVLFGSIRVSSSPLSELISDVESDIIPGHSIRVSGLKSILSGLFALNYTVFTKVKSLINQTLLVFHDIVFGLAFQVMLSVLNISKMLTKIAFGLLQ